MNLLQLLSGKRGVTLQQLRQVAAQYNYTVQVHGRLAFVLSGNGIIALYDIHEEGNTLICVERVGNASNTHSKGMGGS